MNTGLYKAKRVDNGEWVEGYLIKSFTEGCYIVTHFDHILSNIVYYEVDEKTICRYSEFTDKNDKKIWENDIVKEFNSSGDEWNLSQVVFADYSLNLGWCVKGIKTLHEYNHRLFNVGFEKNTASKCEVIGNVFDNPECIK